MNIMTFPWSRGADCRSFTAWLLTFTGPYLANSPIRDSWSNLSLTKKSAHLVVGFAMIHGNQRYPRASLASTMCASRVFFFVTTRGRDPCWCTSHGNLHRIVLYPASDFVHCGARRIF